MGTMIQRLRLNEEDFRGNLFFFSLGEKYKKKKKVEWRVRESKRKIEVRTDPTCCDSFHMSPSFALL